MECFYLTDSQQEEKIIQLIDLHHFIECYNEYILVIDCIRYPINIIEENGIRKGILFFDLKYSSSQDINQSNIFKEQYNLTELWFVFVEEDVSTCKKTYTDFITEEGLEIFYDKIFLFNFFQSAIHPLK